MRRTSQPAFRDLYEPSFKSIGGWTFKDMLECTAEGRAAKRAGKGYSFLMDIAHGRAALPPEMQDGRQPLRPKRRGRR